MSRCVVPRQARAELYRLVRRKTSQAAGLALFRQFDEKCSLLADNPEAGWPAPEIGPEVRWFPLDKHILLYYEPIRGGVRIVQVRDGRQDPRRLPPRK